MWPKKYFHVRAFGGQSAPYTLCDDVDECGTHAGHHVHSAEQRRGPKGFRAYDVAALLLRAQTSARWFQIRDNMKLPHTRSPPKRSLRAN
jgi:hypothetical protein